MAAFASELTKFRKAERLGEEQSVEAAKRLSAAPGCAVRRSVR